MMLNLDADQSQAIHRGEIVRMQSDLGELVIVGAQAYERSLQERQKAGWENRSAKDSEHWGRDNPAS